MDLPLLEKNWKDEMKVDILTSEKHLSNQLLIIEQAGRTCYQSFKGEITNETAKKFIKMLMKRGHESVIEHSNMTVKFSGVSRGFTHELVRHRLCAFSQKSTRYVDESNFEFVLPPGKKLKDKIKSPSGLGYTTLEEVINAYKLVYETLKYEGWRKEDRRQFLPIGIGNEIVISTNFREWRHIFKMRTSRFAHWEIRQAMCILLEKVKPLLDPIFNDFVYDRDDKKGIPIYEQDHLW